MCENVIFLDFDLSGFFFINFVSILDHFQVIKRNLKQKSGFAPSRSMGEYPDLSGFDH